MDDLRERAKWMGVSLDAGQVASLLAFERLLRDRAVPLGLIGEGDASRLRTRHVLDCLRAVLALRANDRDAYDLGSGTGLPGVVVAVARPGLEVGLVEPRRHRAAFLELVVDEMRLRNASVLKARAEDLTRQVDVCFARALAHPERAFALARPLLRRGGRLVCFAGSSWDPAVRVEGAEVRILEALGVESGGPLVIMGRP